MYPDDPDYQLQPTTNLSDTVTAIMVAEAGHGDILVPLDNCGGHYPHEQCPNKELLAGIMEMKLLIDNWLSSPDETQTQLAGV